MPTPDVNSPQNPLKEFALSDSAKEKGSKDFGNKIVLQVENLINSSYFVERNKRFALNRASAAGKMDMKIFRDLLDMNGAVNYTKMNEKAIMIVNTIISRLVARWMSTKLKPKAEAIDPVSAKEKKEKIDEAEFYLDNKQVLAEATEASGVPMIPQDQFVPDDKDHLDLWAHEELRLPEEILFEKGIRAVFQEYNLDSVTLRKLYHDSAEVGLVAIETTMNQEGSVIPIRKVPENCFYSNSDKDDFSDTAIRGAVDSYTISELRSNYPDLKEQDLFKIAQVSKQWKENNNITWNASYQTDLTRPYDDWNVEVATFELRTYDVDRYKMEVTKKGSLVVVKNKKKKESEDDKSYTEKPKWNIYRGSYVRSGGLRLLLEWGEKKNKITSQDPAYVGDAKFSYSFFMYQNVNMRNIAIPEKIEEPVEQMILARLKIQQLVAGMQKSGYIYDIDGMQELDLGNGKLTPLELNRVTNQTGNVYYRGRDAEGNRIENPIRENPNSGSVNQLQQLILTYNYHLSVLKDELGEDPNLMSQASQPRVTTGNIQIAVEQANNSTAHMEDAVIQCLSETANKVACLLHDSVEYGSNQYRDIMGIETVKNRVYKINIEMQPDQQEIQEFITLVNTHVIQNPDFILYISPLKLKTLAQENLKLANIYFENSQRKCLKGKMEDSARQQEQNGQIQQQAAAAKAQGDQQTQDMKMQGEMMLAKEKQKEELIKVIGAVYAKGLPLPPNLQPLEDAIITNIGLPLFVENQEMKAVASQTPMPQTQEQEGIPQEQVPQEQMQMQPQ